MTKSPTASDYQSHPRWLEHRLRRHQLLCDIETEQAKKSPDEKQIEVLLTLIECDRAVTETVIGVPIPVTASRAIIEERAKSRWLTEAIKFVEQQPPRSPVP